MQLLGTREAARAAQVPVRTLLGWVARGRVVAFRDALNGRVFLPADEVERLRPERRLHRVSAPLEAASPDRRPAVKG
ncbi:hypothetical protein U7230_07070 [Carboxydochorda subterranea]|uniref:Helix-turn-helix domain-containing protein n=1 Tax=Carboxydichorda subterranea TaxID=3109565 RepID=A0ABZ1C0X1_9FIRM|nr:hypothetical protein [Limnochorda sp. L945t]WRP18746.1 hypothetical protein U7230_07070 [Limnochorda sp. L945t]